MFQPLINLEGQKHTLTSFLKSGILHTAYSIFLLNISLEFHYMGKNCKQNSKTFQIWSY